MVEPNPKASPSGYDTQPVVQIADTAERCTEGWAELADALLASLPLTRPAIVAIESYPGVDNEEMAQQIATRIGATEILFTADAFLPPPILREQFAQTLGDDPVFSFMKAWKIDSYFDDRKLQAMREYTRVPDGLLLVVGTGVLSVVPVPDLLLCANVGRWELQQRQRSGRIWNLGLNNQDAGPAELYKTAYFLDWRVADRCRHALYKGVDFFLDMGDQAIPRMLPGTLLREAVRATVHRPFRVVPFFDPGPWGGQWMRSRFGLPDGPPNYAWGFDCVPEENSLVFGFGERRFELPAIVLVHEEPEALLGTSILHQFGAEFPIRFDLLDTVDGGNLSLQVHPTRAYIHKHFGMTYTQDESYYMLHSEPGASMYLGLRDSVDSDAMRRALYAAQSGTAPFSAGAFVAEWPTRTHDHFSIPAGTVHCSGAGNVVLEISATPYIFTFKLWDWDRTGLDGKPRPIHLEHGLANIAWERTAAWVGRELIGQTQTIGAGEGWQEERTGLHAAEFLETRRHWFSAAVPHHTHGNLQVLNLVEGPEAVITSPDGAFSPFVLHYAETVIVPASVGPYVIAPSSPAGKPLATLKAYVRNDTEAGADGT